jgi:hypothetical protein
MCNHCAGHTLSHLPQAPSSNRTSSFPQYGFPTTFPARLSATVTVDTRARPLWGVPFTPACPALPPPGPPVSDCLALTGQSVNMKLGFFAPVHSIASNGWRIQASFFTCRLGRSMASRSKQVLLSCPSSLQGHSDFLSVRNACLAGFIQLGRRLPPPDRGGNVRISGPISIHFPCMLLTLPRVPHQCICPFLPGRHWPSPTTYGVGGYPVSTGSSLNRALPITNARSDFTRLHHSSSYCGLQVWLAPLIGFTAPCRGKFRPSVTTQTRPQPTYLQRQLIWRVPFIPLANGFVTSYTWR